MTKLHGLARLFRVAGVAVALAAIGSVAVAETFIVENGQPNAEIVIAEDPPRMTKLAAEELRDIVEKISGARLPIANAPGGAAVQIYVGKSPHTERLGVTDEGLPGEGYRTVSGENWLVLIGQDADYEPKEPYARHGGDRERAKKEWDELTGARWAHPGVSTFKAYNSALKVWQNDQKGSLNAVYGFLRSLGCRWYFPGELGEILPKATSIALPEVNETVRPDTPLRREMMFYGHRFFMASRDDALWLLRLGLHYGGGGGHGIDYAIHHENTRRDHPEYYLMSNGKRDTVSRGGKPCLSSPGLLRSNVEFAKAYFDIYGGDILSVMPTDGYVTLCECNLCKGKGTVDRGYQGQISDYVWGYVNRVAEEVRKTHPEKKISCSAYGAYRLPPEGIDKLNPNIAVRITEGRANYYDSKLREEALALRRAWLDKLPGEKVLRTYNYYLHARPGKAWAGIPVYYPRLIGEDLRSLKGVSVGEFIEVYSVNRRDGKPAVELAVNHLNCYLTARLWWDADQDVDAMLDEYCEKFYGPAAEEMKAFIDYCEANWPRMVKEVEPIDRAIELLSAARDAAGDTVYGQRVALVDEYIEPMRQLRPRLALGRENVPQARVAHARSLQESGLKLDGRLDEEIWQRIPAYSLKETETGRPGEPETTFKTLWMFGGDNAIYFAVMCKEPDVAGMEITATEDGDTRIWNGDCIEILIETQSHSYYQFAVSPAGALVDVDRKRGINTTWSSGAEVATHIGEDFWSAEIRIPLAGDMQADLNPDFGVSGRTPSNTQPWHFNILRQRKRDGSAEHLVFSPLGDRGFHDIMTFGKLYRP